jgi:hypothetical protein
MIDTYTWRSRDVETGDHHVTATLWLYLRNADTIVTSTLPVRYQRKLVWHHTHLCPSFLFSPSTLAFTVA